MEKYLRWAVDQGVIPRESADLISRFMIDRVIERGMANTTAANRTRYLSMFLRALPRPPSTCTTDEVKKVLASMRNTYKPNTFGQMLYIGIAFLEWLQPPNVNIADLKKIRPPQADRTTKTAASMLTEEEVQALIKATRNSRDRAIVTTMYEGGFRPIELVRLTWDEIKFDEYGCVINCSEKTGIPRYIRLIIAAPLLAQWKSDYPAPIVRGARVFVKARGTPPEPITTVTITRLYEKLVRQSGLEKHFYPYLVRHSRVTHMMEQQIPESVIKLQHWGSLRTDMLATYAHVSNEYVDRVLLEQAGISGKKTRKEILMKPIQCPHCRFVNLPGAEFCGKCGLSFTEEGMTAVGVVRNLMADPDDLIAYAEWRKKQRA
jgi:integrase